MIFDSVPLWMNIVMVMLVFTQYFTNKRIDLLQKSVRELEEKILFGNGDQLHIITKRDFSGGE